MNRDIYVCSILVVWIGMCAIAAPFTGGDSDCDGLSDDMETGSYYTNPCKWDTDSDGMPDGWEACYADTDPLLADAEAVVSGDVMAYQEVDAKIVSVHNTKDAPYVTHDYIFTGSEKIWIGTDADTLPLHATWEYGGLYAMGTNVSLVAETGTTNRVHAVREGKVVLVHAQVYAKNGFDAKTAVCVDGSVNTKPFTAIDKYLLGHYFQALGMANAAESSDFWRSWTLKPLNSDNDFDGVADGWELYVMFGPDVDVFAGVKMSDMKISPWRFDDRFADLNNDGVNVVQEFNNEGGPVSPWLGRAIPSDRNDENTVHVSLTVTNVVIHYVINSVVPERSYPATYDTGFVNVITEVKSGGAVGVPATWMVNYPMFATKFGTDFTKSLMKPTGKRDGAGHTMCVWQDYVAGTDPTDVDDVFTASVTMVDGQPVISYTPELNDAEKALRVYKTWGKVRLQDAEWSEVPSGHEGDYNFFKVTVEMK